MSISGQERPRVSKVELKAVQQDGVQAGCGPFCTWRCHTLEVYLQ